MKKRSSASGAKQDFFTYYRAQLKSAMIAIVPEPMQKEVTDDFMAQLTSTVRSLYEELNQQKEVPNSDRTQYVPFKFTRTESFVFGLCAAFICSHICEPRLNLSPSKIKFEMIKRDAKALLISQSKPDQQQLEFLKAAYSQVFIGDVTDGAVGTADGDRSNPYAASKGLTPSESEVDRAAQNLSGAHLSEDEEA